MTTKMGAVTWCSKAEKNFIFITFISLMNKLLKKNLKIWGDKGEERNETTLNVLILQKISDIWARRLSASLSDFFMCHRMSSAC